MSTQARAAGTRQFFARGGALSRWHPNYEFRPGQLQMAEAVEAALGDKRHLIVEAGTGTGKTLAYLVPAVLSGKRVVVSTGTKNLQEQLFFKDVPFLQRNFARPLKVCYMKGRGNYACRQRIYDAEREPVLEGLEEINDFRIIRDWEKSTEVGDRAEILNLPESSSAWAKIDARGERCTFKKCPQFDRCFITAMHQRAQESDIVIVNHALFFADLAIRGEEHEGGILPQYDAVVFDEAHELEDVAAQHFGMAVSNYRVQDLARDVAALSRQKRFGSPELDRMLDAVEEHSQSFFALFPGADGREALRARQAFLGQHERHYRDITAALDLLYSHLAGLPEAPAEVAPLVARVLEIAGALRYILESDDVDYVYWVERRGRGVFLQATPIDVGPVLAEKLFDRASSVVLTSATLAVAGGFGYLEKRLGIRGARSAVVPGSFDYQKQALLYVPPHLPEPRSPAFLKAACEEVARILRASRGRAFVLFTSYQQMRLMHDRLAGELGFPVLLQGEAPRSALLDRFRRTPNCVLFATASFWQGVDVPGEQLSCVIIDKLPFAVPNDPIVEARMHSIRRRGGEPFYDYQVPQAAIALKQGFGRLIRGRGDRGVLALLDNRILKQRYGQVFFDSLPDYRFTTQGNEVERFFDV